MSQSQQSFVEAVSNILGVARNDAVKFFDDVKAQLFKLGFHAESTDNGDTVDAVAANARTMIDRMTLNRIGKAFGALVVGGFLIFALPEAMAVELGILIIVAVAAIADYAAMRDFVQTSLKRIFDDIQKGFFSTGDDLPS